MLNLSYDFIMVDKMGKGGYMDTKPTFTLSRTSDVSDLIKYLAFYLYFPKRKMVGVLFSHCVCLTVWL